MDGQEETKTETPATPKPTLDEMRVELKAMNDQIVALDAQVIEKQTERTKIRKEYRALIGKIETRVAAGEV